MKRIRLQVQVMPWHDQGSTFTAASTRRDAEFKWIQPCSEDLTIQGLVDSILLRWARLCPGMGSLNIRYLKTAYDDLLDMEDTVGAIFDDRAGFPDMVSSDAPLPTSIVRVYRYPPDPKELPDVQRFGSLMPESSARPRKRPLVVPSQDPPNSQHPLTSIERQDLSTQSVSNKRQRIHDSSIDRPHSIDRRLFAGERQMEGIDQSVQLSGTQGSVHQVFDSQETTSRKQHNPYGTPTSLSLVSPQEPARRNQNDVSFIPDSPTRRGSGGLGEAHETAIVLDRESTKSESPEIRLSVHDVPPRESRVTLTKLSKGDEIIESPQVGEPPATLSPLSPFMQEINRVLETRDDGDDDDDQRSTTHTHQTPTRQPRELGSSSRSRENATKQPLRYPEQIFDEIESDNESFQGKQQMHNNKRLKRDHAAQQRKSNADNYIGVRKDQNDERFLIPSVPARASKGRLPSGELGSHQTANDTEPSNALSKHSDSHHPAERNDNSLLPYSYDVGGIPNHHDQSSEDVQIRKETPNKKPILARDDADANAVPLGPEKPSKPSKNWSDLDVEHPIKVALSQGRKPDPSTLLNPDSIDDFPESQSGPFWQGDQMMNLCEEQQQVQKSGAVEDEGDASLSSLKNLKSIRKQDEGQNLDHALVQDHQWSGGSKDISSRCPSEESSIGPQQLEGTAQRTSPNTEESRLSSEMVARNSAVQPDLQGEKTKPIETPARNCQSKEKALSMQAEQMILETEGAKQLQVEKLQKQKTSTESRSDAMRAKTPASAKYKPRTEEQKAARRERDSRQRAERAARAKAIEQIEDPKWGEKLFKLGGSEARRSRERIDSDSEEKRPKQTKMATSTQKSRKPKLLSVEQAEGSPRPSEMTPKGQNRKSLTPILPLGAITKSPSNRSSLKSSSPLISRASVALDTPLRSALKHDQTPSTLRRSVSFMDGEDRGGVAPKVVIPPLPAVPTPRPVKSLVDINNELALGDSGSFRASSRAEADPKPHSTSSHQSNGRKEKVQQKLNVISDKKLKGRASNPPFPQRQRPKIEPDTSHNEDSLVSESSSDEIVVNGYAKAGPSTRKKTSRPVRAQDSWPVNPDQEETPIDPEIVNLKSSNEAKVSPSISLHSAAELDEPSSPDSGSRSPALAISESISESSDSSARPGAEADSNSEAQSGSGSESNPESTNNGDAFSATSSQNGKSGLSALSVGHHDGKSSSAQSSSKAGSDVDEAGPHSQLEGSLRGSSQNSSTSPFRDPDKFAKAIQNQSDRSSDKAHVTYKYPTLSAQRKLAEGPRTNRITSSLPRSQVLATKPTQDSSSSSASDDSTVSSDDEEDSSSPVAANSPTSRTSSKAKTGGIRGLKGVMKLARSIGFASQE